ncbi:MAG: hypothetical protein LBU17_00970 [Treponema sp.]|jgi:hypothetical protein|nr:hypothetical protein [Treponema sp.]
MNGNYVLSENANRQALEIDPKDGYAKKGLGLALFRQENGKVWHADFVRLMTLSDLLMDAWVRPTHARLVQSIHSSGVSHLAIEIKQITHISATMEWLYFKNIG